MSYYNLLKIGVDLTKCLEPRRLSKAGVRCELHLKRQVLFASQNKINLSFRDSSPEIEFVYHTQILVKLTKDRVFKQRTFIGTEAQLCEIPQGKIP